MSDHSQQRYWSIFQEVPIALLEQDWTGVHTALASLAAEGITDFDQYFAESPDRVDALVSQIVTIDANTLFLDLVGQAGARSIEDVHGRLHQIFDDASRPVLGRAMAALARNEPCFDAALPIRSLNGQRREVQLRLARREQPEAPGAAGQDAPGRVRVLASLADAAPRRQMESELHHLQEELARTADELAHAVGDLERSNFELERLAYMTSHDLQEPLRMIEGYTSLLARRYQGKLDHKADVYIEHAVDGTKRMRELIDALLALARLELHRQPMVPVDCNLLVGNVLAQMAPQLQRNEAQVTCGEQPTVHADASQLALLLQSLLSNAIKFRGDQPPRIHLDAARGEGEWIFSVADQGIGIAENLHEQIFDVFRRLHPRQEYPGTGIGLAFARSIVKRHRGRIWVESSPGQGATFYFTIPDPTGPHARPTGPTGPADPMGPT